MNTLSEIRWLQANLNRHPKLKQFPLPTTTWEKLQKDQFEINKSNGLQDNRVDCAINSLAFVGAMDRSTAEKTSAAINARKSGVFTHDIRAFLESKDGYEKKPHKSEFFTTQTSAYMSNRYSELKPGCSALISIHRLNGASGHTATIIRMNDKFMVFDPQTEKTYEDVYEWLDREAADCVEVVTEVDKRVHCRSASNVSVRRLKPDQDESANYKFSKVALEEDVVVVAIKKVKQQQQQQQQPWRVRNLEKSRQARCTKKEQTDHQFRVDMERVGFAKYLN